MGASATRKEARKRRFGEPNAIPGGRKKSSKHKTADGPSSTTSSATKLPTCSDHWDGSSVSELRSADKVGSGEDNNEHQNLPLKNVLSPKNYTNQRFVVFVGNLPYTATDESIKRHFASLRPTSIRHRYEKGSGRSRGFTFLEFRNYDHMKTCLKRFHQSAFDDGVSSVRHLNIELTAGGGGSKSKDRRTKLKEKNDKLRQERVRRALNEGNSKEANIESAKNTHRQSNIHPSRMTRMKSVR